MNKPLLLPLFGLLLGMLTSCHSGVLLIQRDPAPPTVTPTRVISIDPEYYGKKKKRESPEEAIIRSEEKEEEIREQLVKASRAAGIELEIYGAYSAEEVARDYFNDLASLKRQILRATSVQEVTADRKGKSLLMPSYENLDEPIVLPAHFSQLSQKYGTPYFAVQGVISGVYRRRLSPLWVLLFPPNAIFLAFPKEQALSYTIIVDVTKGQVTYREIRILDKPPTESNLNAMFHDSFRQFKRGITRAL